MSSGEAINWDDLRYFLAVAEEGSLSAAARILRVNPATVSRHVDALEERLSVRLFDRRQDGYGLTQAGEKLLDRARTIETEMFMLARAFDAEDRGLTGIVFVTATESLTVPFLIPNLSLLKARHPGIRLQLVSEYRMLNLSRREADGDPIGTAGAGRPDRAPDWRDGRPFRVGILCGSQRITGKRFGAEGSCGDRLVGWLSRKRPRQLAAPHDGPPSQFCDELRKRSFGGSTVRVGIAPGGRAWWRRVYRPRPHSAR